MARPIQNVPSAGTNSNPTRKRGPVFIGFSAFFCLAYAPGYCDIFYGTGHMVPSEKGSAQYGSAQWLPTWTNVCAKPHWS